MKPRITRQIPLFLAGFLSLMIWACDDQVDLPDDVNEPNDAAFAIGDVGPAGGIVFLDKGASTDGWRYLEIAMQDLGRAEWGCFNTPITNSRSSTVGSGAENTQHIIDLHDAFQSYYTNPGECSTMSDGTVAAKIAADFSFNGFDDWHLPSSEEMFWVYQNLHAANLASFSTDDLYWTSTENDDNTAVAINFTNGAGGFLCKQCSDVVTVRAVRYFK